MWALVCGGVGVWGRWCVGASLLQSERGVGVSCVGVYICIHNLPRFPRCPNAPASVAPVARSTSATAKSFGASPSCLSTFRIKIFINSWVCRCTLHDPFLRTLHDLFLRTLHDLFLRTLHDPFLHLLYDPFLHLLYAPVFAPII